MRFAGPVIAHMPGMLCTVVGDEEAGGDKRSVEALADFVDDRAGGGGGLGHRAYIDRFWI
ncbi:hypothetical protein GCM10011395_27200 [Sphingomonas psychrolutea]|uniref:Uncharacterized protein n=1 Tax=Sphingomonas psychrolutea TaxID=1259676 RepID=A0ABQ1H2I1_9SPHN|nr:hypothetical protein GCM10011395_27200 [Sphingomonas psychrolutea]